jgi:hypothetical protein
MLAGAQLSGLDRVRSSSNLRSHITETTFVHCTPEAAADGLEKNLPCCSLKKMRIDPREKASRRHVMDDATRCRLLLLFFYVSHCSSQDRIFDGNEAAIQCRQKACNEAAIRWSDHFGVAETNLRQVNIFAVTVNRRG